MNNDRRTEYVARDRILKLLSDAELASVGNAEAVTRLADGDEYIDLDALDAGVRRAQEQGALAARTLPRKAVHQDTWNKILAMLPSS